MKKQNKANDFIKIKDIWNNFIYSDDGNITGGIKVDSMNLFFMFENERKQKIEQFRKVILGINKSFKITSIDKSINLSEHIDLLKDKKEESKNKIKKKVLEEDIVFADNLSKIESVKKREFLISVSETEGNENLLKIKLNDLEKELTSIGLNSEIIKTDEWKDIVYSFYNPNNSLDVFRNSNKGITTPFKDKVAPNGIKIGDRHIELGDAYISTVTINLYPSVVSAGFIGRVINLDNIKLSMSMTKMDNIEISKTLKKGMSEVKSKMINTNDINDNILLNNQLSDYEELLHKIDREHESFIKLTINFMVYGKTLEELNKNKFELKNLLTSFGLGGADLMFEQENGFNMMLPTNNYSLENNYGLPVPSLTAAATFPFVLEALNDEELSTIIGDDYNGNLVLFDIWKREDKRNNSNLTIVGKSGSGKSVFMKKLIRSNWARGSKIIVIDPEREYKDLCDNLGGNWLDVGSGKGGMINPLEIKKESNDEINNTLTKQFQLFRTFLKYYYSDLTELELTQLEDALVLVYKDKGIDFDTDISTLKREEYPTLEDLYNKLLEIKKTINPNKETIYEKLIMIIKKLIKGADAVLFNGISTVDTDSDLLVFDIHTLIDSDESILKAQFFNILSYIWNEISNDRKEQIILVVDEAHLLIDNKNKDGIDFLKKASKRIRKYNGSLIVSTQNMIDFTADEIKRYGQVIIDNSTYLLLMLQGSKEIEALKKMLKLSDYEEQFLLSASRGEGLFNVSNNKKIPVRIFLREEEKELFGDAGGR